MARVLILSSFVAASQVGGAVQALALARLGVEPVLAPTVLFGRRPDLGPPGGAAVDAATLRSMLEAIAAEGTFGRLDAVITGYFATPEQVALAAETLHDVREQAPSARLVVDPVMGDEARGLYVKEAVAEAITSRLVPLGDVIAPNAWELARLTGGSVEGPQGALAAARTLGAPALVSSVTRGGRIGVVYAGPEGAWYASHVRRPTAPKGAGDLLTVYFTAALALGYASRAALAAAASAVAALADSADGLREFQVSSLPRTLAHAEGVEVEPLDA